jgi:hypothetical protein
MSLDPVVVARLIKLLGMTSSTFDGEALVAIRKANNLLKSAGLTWADVVTVSESAQKSSTWREPACWRDAIGICLGLTDAPLSAWDRKFLIGISGRKMLTEKQKYQLDRIVESCRQHARMAA